MLAVDTNIVVRYLTADDPEQFAKARALIDGEDIFVCKTVLLETEWVLRRGYRFSRDRIIAALTAFAGLPRYPGGPRLSRQGVGLDGEGDGFCRCTPSR